MLRTTAALSVQSTHPCDCPYPSFSCPSCGDSSPLGYLWSSDFRTHITDKRWQAYCNDLAEAERLWVPEPVAQIAEPARIKVEARVVDIEMPNLIAQLDRRRGLAIRSLQFGSQTQAVIGGLPHGHFDDIALQADWYTGDCVFEKNFLIHCFGLLSTSRSIEHLYDIHC